jgi:hypothetical protein
MTCTHCGATIAAKALICYKCGNATTAPRVKPPSEGSLFDKPRRRIPLAIVVWIVLIVIALILFAVYQDRTVAEAVGRYVEAQRAALAGRGPAVTVAEILEPAIRESVREGAKWGGGALAAGSLAAVFAGRGWRSSPATPRDER